MILARPEIMKADMANYYAERASEYERIYAKPERGPDIRRLRQLLGSLFQGRDVLNRRKLISFELA